VPHLRFEAQKARPSIEIDHATPSSRSCGLAPVFQIATCFDSTCPTRPGKHPYIRKGSEQLQGHPPESMNQLSLAHGHIRDDVQHGDFTSALPLGGGLGRGLER